MIRSRLVMVILCSSILLVSCSRYKRNENAYVYAKAGQPFVVPRGATAPVQQPYYPVPSSANLGGGRVSIVPPGSKIQQYRDEKKKPRQPLQKMDAPEQSS